MATPSVNGAKEGLSASAATWFSPEADVPEDRSSDETRNRTPSLQLKEWDEEEECREVEEEGGGAVWVCVDEADLIVWDA